MIPEDFLFIGVDGGGSGCRARLADAGGRALGEGTAGPAAVRFGIAGVLAAVESAARAAAVNAGLPAEVLARADAVIGLAGIGRKDVVEALTQAPHPFRSVAYVNDATIACLGAHGGRDGGVVIVGTGSVGLALLRGREVRVGGYGFPISDEGSGADIGLRAIGHSLRAHDGRIAPTALTRAVMARFDNDALAAIAWTDQATATDYATLAPLVMHHAENGDSVARGIVIGAAKEIGALIGALAARGAGRIALVGGLATPIASWLAPDAQSRLVPSEADALDGALRLARRSVGKSHAA